jgi:hypothetical protein
MENEERENTDQTQNATSEIYSAAVKEQKVSEASQDPLQKKPWSAWAPAIVVIVIVLFSLVMGFRLYLLTTVSQYISVLQQQSNESVGASTSTDLESVDNDLNSIDVQNSDKDINQIDASF